MTPRELHPQAYGANVASQTDGMDRNPELPTGYNNNPLGSNVDVQTPAGAVARGQAEAQTNNDERKEATALAGLDVKLQDVNKIVNDIKWFENQFTTDPAMMARQANYKDKIVELLNKLPVAITALDQAKDSVTADVIMTKNDLTKLDTVQNTHDALD